MMARKKAEPRGEVDEEKGLVGVEVDQTPNEHYTLAGVIAGKPTPENGR